MHINTACLSYIRLVNKQRDKWLHKAENYKYCKKEYSKLLDLVEVMPKA